MYSQLLNALAFHGTRKPTRELTSWGRGTEVDFSGAPPKHKEQSGVRAIQRGT